MTLLTIFQGMHQFWVSVDMGVGRKHEQWANILLQGLDKDVQWWWEQYHISPTDLKPSIATISLVMNLHGQQKHIGKQTSLH